MIFPLKNVFELLGLLLSMNIEYLILTGFFFLLFYVWRRKKYWYLKIQPRFPEKKHLIRDILYSLSTIVIFGLVIVPVVWSGKYGLTRVYHPIDKYGYGYYALSLVIMVVVHDAYFYWTHRFLHWKPMYKWVHVTHHLSLNPTPFSVYAFHPVEAIVEVGIIPLIAFTIPHHASAITIFTLYQLSINLLGHLGFEFLPKGFTTHKIFKWHNTPTHHNMHHRFIKSNFGLYFNFWDRWMGTNHPKYDEVFDEVIARREQHKIVAEPELRTIGGDISIVEPENI